MMNVDIRKCVDDIHRTKSIDAASIIINDNFIPDNELSVRDASIFLRKFTNRDFCKTFSQEFTNRLCNKANRTMLIDGQVKKIDIDTLADAITFYESLRRCRLIDSHEVIKKNDSLTKLHAYINEINSASFWDINIKNDLVKIGIEHTLIDSVKNADKSDNIVGFDTTESSDVLSLRIHDFRIYPLITRDLDKPFTRSKSNASITLFCEQIPEFKKDCLKSLETIIILNDQHDPDESGVSLDEKLFKRCNEINETW